jgi:hypothetical protein
MRIYNLSSLVLTPLEEMVLGLGINYIPLPKTSPETLTTTVHLALDKLQRKLRPAFHFKDPSDPTPTSIPLKPNGTRKKRSLMYIFINIFKT